MLNFIGRSHRTCDGVSRRSFLRVGALGIGGLSLPNLLRYQAQAGQPSASSTKKKAVILIWAAGGPSHIDMYDLKPDAPAEFRGEFKPIATKVPGVQICEHFPLQARMWDKLAAIRSIISVNEHSDSLVMTGKSSQQNMTANHPSF